ncbi:hypothetical protein HJ588_11165 [Flexivirga sp. ID2601S]|uniref:Peptidase MA-like domain-containing protein n=1 Tax=Flexivirga aerilata TaxID=1656889 RepID=A0A849AKI9_9MICO|nr:hypothetical protein [Flexivirga aerilata]NNG39831.1 hypothetical protein [Flexivirga aerilata]
MTGRMVRCLGGVLLTALTVAGCSSGTGPAPGDGGSTPTASSRSVRAAGLVVTGTATDGRLQTVARDAEQAIRQVRAMWGSQVLRDTVRIEVPADEAGFRSRGGGGGTGRESGQIAATTTTDGRVVLSPRLFDAVTAQGIEVVLTHELTHVALGQATLTGVPRWVLEGSAEVTAFGPTGLGLTEAAPTLAAQVRAGNVPAGPPADAAFEAGPEAAYQGAYAWCRFLFDRYGGATFTRFVRAADAGQRDAFQQAFGVQAASLGAAYRQFLRDAIDGAGPTGSTSSGR